MSSTPNRLDFSLTLIPPSPVTDCIIVDVRAGVWNHGAAEKTVAVSFYLDREDEASLLHREEVAVPAGGARAAEFRWSTEGQAGEHRILAVADDASGTRRLERPMNVLSTGERSTDRLGGAWAGIYHWSEKEGKPWNAAIKTMTDDQWRELVRAMHGVGMDIIVLQELLRNEHYVGKHAIESEGYQGRAFYPSRLYPGRMEIAAKDPVEAILSEADAHGMHVFMGVGMYAWFDFTPGSLEWHKRVADELWDLYGHHPSFYGWYVAEEIFGNLGMEESRRQEIVDFFREFRAHVRSYAPDRPVMLASNAHAVPEGADYYPALLRHLDVLCPFAFHRMPEGDLTGEEAAALLQQFCDKAETHLWMDMEIFDFGPDMELLPRSLEGLLSDLRRFPNFEKILCYQFPGLMSAPEMSLHPGGPETVKAYEAYRAFLAGKG